MKNLFLISTLIFWAQLACAMDTPEFSELVQAVFDNEEDRVLAALDAGANVNATGEEGDTLLMHAVDRGYVEVCSALIKGRANVHQRTTSGITALSLAIDSNQEQLIKLLIAEGADINAPCDREYTPLIKKTYLELDDQEEEHRYERVKFLLKCGADPNVQRKKNLKTALMYAVKKDDEALCALLLKHGAYVGLQDREGRTALFLAVHYGNGRICEMLVNHQAALDRSMITFLCCLKQSQNKSERLLYGLSRHLLSPYFKQFSLQILLKARTVKGYTAYDHLQMEYIHSDDKQLLAACDYLQLEYLKPDYKQRVVKNDVEKIGNKKIGNKNKKCSIQ